MWFWLSLGSALASTIISILLKASKRDLDTSIVSWAVAFGTFLCSGVYLLFTGSWVSVERVWLLALLVTVIDYVALLLYVKGIRVSEISLASPLVAFTPFFILFVGPLINGQIPSVLGATGVLFVVFGSYAMAFSESKEGLLKPIIALSTDSGCRLVFLVAVMWAVTSSLHAPGIELSSPMVYACLRGAMLSAALLVTFVIKVPDWPRQMYQGRNTLLAVAVCSFLADMGMLFAMKTSFVVYVIAVKKSGILFTVLFGSLFFKESNLAERLLGSALMVVGILLIALS